MTRLFAVTVFIGGFVLFVETLIGAEVKPRVWDAWNAITIMAVAQILLKTARLDDD